MQHGWLSQPFISAIRAVALDVVIFLRGIECKASAAGFAREFNALNVGWREDYFALRRHEAILADMIAHPLARLGFGPRFGLPARAFFSSASISFRSHFEMRRTFRSALSNIAALGRLAFGLAIFSAYNTPVGRRI
jgi:hypothetical protein